MNEHQILQLGFKFDQQAFLLSKCTQMSIQDALELLQRVIKLVVDAAQKGRGPGPVVNMLVLYEMGAIDAPPQVPLTKPDWWKPEYQDAGALVAANELGMSAADALHDLFLVYMSLLKEVLRRLCRCA